MLQWCVKKAGETMNSKTDYIAVFDSGVGGISVLRQLRKVMPGERYLYFGDSANAPYGSRPTEQVRQLSLNVAEKLVQRGIKALVVACNTATSAAIEQLRAAYPEYIVVGIEPALKLAADRFPGGSIGVMATEVTLREEKFARLMQRFSHTCSIATIPAPGVVQLVESGKAEGPEMDALARQLLSPYREKLDAVVLGCTHYPFAWKAFSRALGENTVLLDGGAGTALQTRRRLEAAGLLENGNGELIIENSLDSPRMLALSAHLAQLEDW